mmetsp:Transcript_62219/g.184013  ORF Transcript_62219/g.184013 Transcript_62219/m.184013 type:complete len:223 (+) Transcript_62219:2746-3414(+)
MGTLSRTPTNARSLRSIVCVAPNSVARSMNTKRRSSRPKMKTHPPMKRATRVYRPRSMFRPYPDPLRSFTEIRLGPSSHFSSSSSICDPASPYTLQSAPRNLTTLLGFCRVKWSTICGLLALELMECRESMLPAVAEEGLPGSTTTDDLYSKNCSSVCAAGACLFASSGTSPVAGASTGTTSAAASSSSSHFASSPSRFAAAIAEASTPSSTSAASFILCTA